MSTQPPAAPAPQGPGPYAQAATPQPPHAQAPSPQGPYPQAPYGQAPYPQAPYGQAPPYPQAPYGQSPYGGGPALPPQSPAGAGGSSAARPPGPPAARPPLPWWAAILAVLGVLVVLGAVTAAAGALFVEAATRSTSEAVDETGVRTLRIEGVTGGVDLKTDGARAGSVTGDRRVTTSWQDAEIETVRDGDELLLRATCPDQGWPRRCEVTYDLQVDPDVDVVVDIVTGGMRARGLAGDVEVSVTAGGVLLEESTSQRVDVSVTTGGIAMSFLEPPREVEAAATTGGVDIAVPSDGTSYAVRTSVTVGDDGVSVPVDDAADRSIVVSTTVGGISVHTADQPGWDDQGRPGG